METPKSGNKVAATRKKTEIGRGSASNAEGRSKCGRCPGKKRKSVVQHFKKGPLRQVTSRAQKKSAKEDPRTHKNAEGGEGVSRKPTVLRRKKKENV